MKKILTYAYIVFSMISFIVAFVFYQVYVYPNYINPKVDKMAYQQVCSGIGYNKAKKYEPNELQEYILEFEKNNEGEYISVNKSIREYGASVSDEIKQVRLVLCSEQISQELAFDCNYSSGSKAKVEHYNETRHFTLREAKTSNIIWEETIDIPNDEQECPLFYPYFGDEPPELSLNYGETSQVQEELKNYLIQM